MKWLLVLLGVLVATFAGLGGDARPPAAPVGIVADHAGERRVPPGHPVMDGQMPFWMNMPYSMARGGNGRAVPRVAVAMKPEVVYPLPASQAVGA